MGIDLIGCDPLAHLGVIASTLLRAREPTRYIISAKKVDRPSAPSPVANWETARKPLIHNEFNLLPKQSSLNWPKKGSHFDIESVGYRPGRSPGGS